MQLPQDRLWLLHKMAQVALHYCGSAYASPIRTTLSCALARVCDEPYGTANCPSCHFGDGTPICHLHASDWCPSLICAGLRQYQVQICAAFACTALALALGDSSAVANPPSTYEVRPTIVIRGQEFFLLERYPEDARGRLEFDNQLIEELDMKLIGILRNMCKNNPLAAQPTSN